ncbi:MAG: hypothetical protein KDA47_09765, partial [Planctomycetales bacterium]|nr:hypothetical protein [Planctomycetales bacterium]
GLLVVTLLYALWRTTFQAVDPRLLLSPPSAPMPTPAALSQIGEIDVRDMPFDKAVKALAQRYGFEVEFDWPTLSPNQSYKYDKPVTLTLNGVTVRSVLNNLIRQSEYEFVVATVRNGSVVLTINDELDTNKAYWETRLYPPLNDCWSIQTMAECERHEWFSGYGGACELVSGTPEFHETVELIRQHLDRQVAGDHGAYSTEPIYLDGPSQPGNARIREVLDTPVDLHVKDMSLSDLANMLASRYRIPVLFNSRRWSGDPHTNRMNGRFQGVSLRTALEMLLAEGGGEYAICDEALWLTVGKTESTRVIYPVKDLVSYLSTRPFLKNSRTTTAQDVLRAVGAPKNLFTRRGLNSARVGMGGGIDVPSELDAYLEWSLRDSDSFGIVACSESQHARIRRGLEVLRREMVARPNGSSESERLSPLSEALHQSVVLEADESIVDFGHRLAREFGVSVCVHDRYLAGLKIQGRAPPGTLKSSIDHLLQDSGFLAVAVGDVLLISSTENRARNVIDCYRLALAGSGAMNDYLGSIFVVDCGDLVGSRCESANCSRLGDLLLIEHDARVHQILGPLIQQLNSGSKEPTILQPTHSRNPGLEDRGLSFYPASGILEYFNSKSETSEYVDYEETTEAFLCKLFEWRLPTGVCFSSALTPAPTLPSNRWPRGGMSQVDGFLAVPAVQEDQQVITDTLRKLEANLQSLPPSGLWQFVESLSESPTSKCPFYRVYDLRGLGIHVSNEGPGPWQEIILRVCQGPVYSCASRSSHVIVLGDQRGHQDVEEVFKVLSTNAKLRAGFAAFAIRGRRALDAGASFPSADELLTESLSSESLVIRRVAAFLVSHNYTRVLSDSVMLRALRTAWDGQDEVSLQLLCSVVRWRACGGEVVDLLREVVMETESPGVFSAAI